MPYPEPGDHQPVNPPRRGPQQFTLVTERHGQQPDPHRSSDSAWPAGQPGQQPGRRAGEQPHLTLGDLPQRSC